MAGIVPVDGRNGLVAIDLDTRKPGPPTKVRLSDIGWFEWVNDERLVFTVLDFSVGEANRFDFYRRVEAFLDKNLRVPR